ncbi:exodeoxyribonuclease VII small subunit [Neisseria wadsworthii 9715]|uniref:Exodeoxyribonuclease 7 small subunit n=2 Tax=Neisseriaceae TaxID=481 RepID=G4CM47_9NEIS|nr:exodeoxyribonuclease VII small subunit [Neisseria wadsworthii 9715]
MPFSLNHPNLIMKKAAAPKSFEEALKRLETLTQAMQSSEMPLEEALAAYQEGNELVKYCQAKLAEVEQKLQVLDAGELKELNLDASE